MRQISKDEFEIWRENEVTKALLEQVELSIKEMEQYLIYSCDPNVVMVRNAERNATINTLEKILNWSPIDERNAT